MTTIQEPKLDWTSVRVLRYLARSKAWVRRRQVIRYVLFREPPESRDPILSQLDVDDLIDVRECLGTNGIPYLELKITPKGRERIRTLVKGGTLAA